MPVNSQLSSRRINNTTLSSTNDNNNMLSQTSTLPDGKQCLLPPLQPTRPKSHHDDDDSTNLPPAVYVMKLSKQVAQSLINGAETGQGDIELTAQNKGVIRLPNNEPYTFTTRPIVGAQTETARGVCYSRRSDVLRYVGPVIADLELNLRMSQQLAATTKKRTLEATKASRNNEMKVVNDLHVPNKRPRVRSKTTVEKRPRTTIRRTTPTTNTTNLTSAPAPLSTHPTSSFSNKLTNSSSNSPTANSTNHLTSQRRKQDNSIIGKTIPPTTNASSIRGLRSAPSSQPSSSPFHSPGVSPGRKGSANTGSRANGSTKTTPPRNGLCGLRNVSPGETYSPPLPKPSRPRTQTSSRYSPDALSPLPSAALSPSSPRVGNLRPKNSDKAALRRNVIHILALGEQYADAVKSRVIGSDTSISQRNMVTDLLYEVGEIKNGMFKLRESCWKEVNNNYSTYSDQERTRMKIVRAEAIGEKDRKSNGDTKGKNGRNMTDEDKLEEALECFEKEYGSNGNLIRIRNDRDEAEIRKQFKKLHPIYMAGIEWIEDIAAVIGALQKRWMETKSESERQILAKRIIEKHSRYKTRHAKFSRIVLLMHKRVKDMKQELDDWNRSRSR